ncbi:nickel/cobalt efflux transporter [Aliarcobacter cryaerophilus]|uniref:nickel/cobalt efflux transporter n=1 Tax=Aliarcobacter cryaerophilus TaxID=28198 RepID=UPI003DA5111D
MDIVALLTQGASIWLLLPSAILLGALHGLEPGHSKTMMASFIIAIRGTVWQAILLGVAATISHTAIVWIIALGGLYFGSKINNEEIEPYLQILSAIIIIGISIWMFIQTYKKVKYASHHHDESFDIQTNKGNLTLSIFEENQPPKFRISNEVLENITCNDITVLTQRSDGSTQIFNFQKFNNYFESTDEIPEPHEFIAKVLLIESDDTSYYDIEFKEHNHNHEHTHEKLEDLDKTSKEYQDAHELYHADEIKKRFENKEVTNSQILLFGLTGGLIPCPATITVLLLCLQLKKVTLGATLVFGFSIGLAITLVVTGVISALSIKYMSNKFTGFGDFIRKLPYISSTIILCIGLYIGYLGLSHF